MQAVGPVLNSLHSSPLTNPPGIIQRALHIQPPPHARPQTMFRFTQQEVHTLRHRAQLVTSNGYQRQQPTLPSPFLFSCERWNFWHRGFLARQHQQSHTTLLHAVITPSSNPTISGSNPRSTTPSGLQACHFWTHTHTHTHTQHTHTYTHTHTHKQTHTRLT